MDRRRRVGIYAGLGCVDAGGASGRRRRTAPGAGGDVGQRQRVHSRCPPPGGRLGLRQAGDACRRGGVQGRRPRAGRRRALQRGLDGQLCHSPPMTADPRRRQSPESGPKRAGPRHVCVRTRGFSSIDCWPMARRSGGLRARSSGRRYPQVQAGRPLRGRDGARSRRASTRCSSWASSGACWAPTS